MTKTEKISEEKTNLNQKAIPEQTDLLQKEYSLQGETLKWNKINFRLYQNLEILRLEFVKIYDDLLRQRIREDNNLVKGFTEAAAEFSTDEVIELFMNKEWQNQSERIKEFFTGNEWILNRIAELSLDTESQAREKYLLSEGVVERLIVTCLDTGEKKIDYEPDTLPKCRELMDFVRDLYHDFFFITTSKILR